MDEYVEISGKLVFRITNPERDVTIKVDCQYGTLAKVSFYTNNLITVGCGQKAIIDKAHKLQMRTLTFIGSSGNPGGGKIKIIHTISEEGGNELVYTFPDDYTGQPPFDEHDQQPSYEFPVYFL
jgi:hypothetical protein